MPSLCVTLRAYLLITLTLTFCSSIQGSNKLSICVVQSIHTGRIIENNCRQIKYNNIDCVIARDRVECLRTLAHGRADFAVFEPEDLYASQSFSQAHILITHELRLFQNDTANYEMVAIVSSNVQSLWDTQGKSFCHPGYDTVDNDWTPIYSNYFQNQLLPKKCELSETLLENKIAALSGYFKSACISGAWSSMYDDAIDRRLKSKYENLCALCDNPTACLINDKYHGREGALLCLTENAGDIAWVRREDARLYFKRGQSIDASKYKFLCPDGTVRPMNWWARPCSWITRPWPVVGARSDVAERVAKVIDTLNTPRELWQSLLLQLLEAFRATVVRTDSLRTPEDFLHQFPGLSSAYARSRCYPSRTVRWCLASNLEDRKCQWLREAAYAYGLEPGIACLQQPGPDASLDAVRQGACDFYVAQPEDMMRANEQNLTVALELVAQYPKNFNNIGIFVKSNSNYKRLEDLKGGSACFTKFRSIGWNAFVAVMNNRTNDKTWNCSDEKSMSSFFRKTIFATGEEEENRIARTYDCVLSGRGDVAFVSVNERFKDNDQLRRICVDDSDGEDCVLTWSTLGSVVINEKMTVVRRREIVALLEELDTWFGVHYPAPTPAVTLYSPYDSQPNVIFSENTVNLLQDISYLQLPRPYTQIVEQIKKSRMQATCGTTSVYPYSLLIILAMTSLLSYFF